MSATPEQISYLDPVFESLSRFDPESLGDDNPEAMDIVETAVRQRLSGMSAVEAESVIQSDTELLQDFMTSPGAPETAPYVLGALMGMGMYADFDDFV